MQFAEAYLGNFASSVVIYIGPEEEEAYLRPETCQSIFVDFPRLYKTMRGKLPLLLK